MSLMLVPQIARRVQQALDGKLTQSELDRVILVLSESDYISDGRLAQNLQRDAKPIDD